MRRKEKETNFVRNTTQKFYSGGEKMEMLTASKEEISGSEKESE